MSEPNSQNNNWSPSEREGLRNLIKIGVLIVIVVAITATIIAIVTSGSGG